MKKLLTFLQRNPGLHSIDHSVTRAAVSLERKGLITLTTYEKRNGYKPYPQAKIIS